MYNYCALTFSSIFSKKKSSFDHGGVASEPFLSGMQWYCGTSRVGMFLNNGKSIRIAAIQRIPSPICRFRKSQCQHDSNSSRAWKTMARLRNRMNLHHPIVSATANKPVSGTGTDVPRVLSGDSRNRGAASRPLRSLFQLWILGVINPILRYRVTNRQCNRYPKPWKYSLFHSSVPFWTCVHSDDLDGQATRNVPLRAAGTGT